MTETTTRPQQCEAIVHGRRSIGIMGRGTESFVSEVHRCTRPAVEKGKCAQHAAQAALLSAKLAAKRPGSK